MTVPTIETLSDGTDMTAANHGAADVYAHDTALASALTSLDIATNIYNDKSAIVFGPVRVNLTGAYAVLVDWVVPAISGDATVELYDVNVSPIAASAGVAVASLDDENTTLIQIQTDTGATGSFSTVGQVTIDAYESVTTALDSDVDRTCAEGGTIRVKVVNIVGTPNYHAAISLLGYVSNRST